MGKQKIILTGGPCSGKSTIFNSISHCQKIPEIATMLFEEGYQKPDPWTEEWQAAFQKAIYERQLIEEEKYQDGIILMDRSLVDGLAYGAKFEIPKNYLSNNDIIIMMTSLAVINTNKYEEMFSTNPHRYDTIEQAQQVQNNLEKVYNELGYNCTKPSSIEEGINIINKLI